MADNSIAEGRYKKLFVILASLVCIFYILYLLRTVFTPFLLSFCLAYFLDPVADRLEKWHINRTAGICLLIICAITVLSLFLLLVFPLIRLQIEGVAANIPEYIRIIQSWIAPLSERIFRENAKMIESIVEEGLKNFGNIPLTVIQSVTSYLWKTISGFADFIMTCFSLLIIPVATFYMLRDIDIIKERCLFYIPSKYKEETMSIITEINRVIGNFIRGQLTVSVILAVLYCAGLYIVGTPAWLIIGLIAGLANIVPFMGLLIGMAPAVTITFLHYYDWQHTLGVVLLFAVVQILEGTFITPRIIGKSLGLHPLTIIFAVFLGGSVFGFFGVLLAVPAAAVINVCLKRVFSAYREAFVGEL